MLRRRPRHRDDHPENLSAATGNRAALDGADEHLRSVDHVMRRLIDAGGPIHPAQDRRGSRPEAFIALVRAIVGQQLSTRAARAIWAKVLERFDGKEPTPAQLIAIRADRLRRAGLSRAKVAYLRDLAQRVESGRLDLGRLPDLADEDIIAELTEIKGIGRWTAEMFLMFHLGRPDVISTGDLGLRRAMHVEYGLDELPGPTEFARIAEPWRPHRTLGCLYLWRSLDAAPELVP